uniref:Uncharacterized protein n=2 Tax=Caenorhabditis japonica TaxID=281687 RepID=A0A8R1HGQ0_CAEJA
MSDLAVGMVKASDFFASELCTVVSTIKKECLNDWISKNGTCYEDSCCTSLETATSWHYRLAQLSHVVFSAIGLVIMCIYTWRYASKIMLPENVRVLMNIMLGLMFAHSIDMIAIHMFHIYRSFLVTPANPCFVRVQVSFCAFFRNTYSFCTIGLAFCQYCIYIDRLLRALFKDYVQYQKIIRWALVVKWFVVSAGVIIWVYREEDSDSYLLSCLNIPLDSMGDLTMVTAAVFPINIVCCFLSVVMFRHFNKRVHRSRFEINLHFTAVVDVESSKFLYVVTRTQAIFIVIYPVLSIAMRFFYEDTPRPLHLTFATLSYVFSVYCCAVPAVMVNYVRGVTGNRMTKILSHVKIKSVGKEGADNYFGMMKSQWE